MLYDIVSYVEDKLVTHLSIMVCIAVIIVPVDLV